MKLSLSCYETGSAPTSKLPWLGWGQGCSGRDHDAGLGFRLPAPNKGRAWPMDQVPGPGRGPDEQTASPATTVTARQAALGFRLLTQQDSLGFRYLQRWHSGRPCSGPSALYEEPKDLPLVLSQ